MKRFYVHFTHDPKAEVPRLKMWRTVNAETHQAAALTACKKQMPWDGVIWAHVHGYRDPKHENGMPMVCHSFALNIEGR